MRKSHPWRRSYSCPTSDFTGLKYFTPRGCNLLCSLERVGMDWSLVLTFFFCCTSYFPNSQFEVHEIAICSVVLRHLGWTEIWYRRSFSVACLTSSLSTLWVLPLPWFRCSFSNWRQGSLYPMWRISRRF